MTRRILIAIWALLAVGAAAGVIWFYAAGNVGDPTEVTAPEITSPAPSVADVAPETDPTPESVPTSAPDPVADPSPDTEPVSDPDATPTTVATTVTPEQDASETVDDDQVGAVTVELELSTGTQARFLIFEELRGEPFTVVGVTDQVVGRLRVDTADLAGSQLGDILINARTFVTDSSNRDRAIRGPILSSEQYEFITFRPRAVVGLSGPAEPGGNWNFAVEGDLVIREITQPVIFEVEASWEDTPDGPVLQGKAATTVSRSQFDLSVPSVPFVANVADEVGLELAFVARGSG